MKDLSLAILIFTLGVNVVTLKLKGRDFKAE